MVAALVAGSELELLAACAVSGTGILAIAIGAIVFDDSVGTLIGYPLLLLVGLLLGRTRRGYQVQAEQSAALLAQFEQLQVQQRRTEVLDERNRIAREIHDVLAHSLAALTVQLEAADALLDVGGERGVQKAHEYVHKSRRIAREGLVETRRAIAALREDAPPLPELMYALADAYRGDTGVEAEVKLEGLPRPLQADAGLTFYRAAQESLTNVRKHAPGAAVRLTLVFGDGEIVLTVANGAATEPPSSLADSGGGYGLAGLKERAELIGGSLDAGPYAAPGLPAPGWQVTLRLRG